MRLLRSGNVRHAHMTFECPKCKSPVAREGQRFCYRCGHELNDYYASLNQEVAPSGVGDPPVDDAAGAKASPEVPPPAPNIPQRTVVLDVNAFDSKVEPSNVTPPTARLKILLPTGDVFDRELASSETQIGKGPRNDIVIADPAVSTAHATVRLEGAVYTINDIGSRNGTFVNGDRVEGPRQLSHGDVIGIGLTKLTFLLSEHSETVAIDAGAVAEASSPAVPPALTEGSLALAVVAAGLATKSDVDRVRADSKGRRLYRILIEGHIASEADLRDLMSRTFQIPSIDLSTTPIDEAVVAEFPAKLAREHQVFAVSKGAKGITLAISDATDVETVERLRREIGSPLNIHLAIATQIREQVDRHYGPRLIGVLPSGETLEFLIDKHEVEIGKSSHNHITLTDPTVSNTHAIVIARNDGISIVDLGSRNGTYVNSERLGSQAHTLRHGDKIQLGQTVLTFRNPAETAANRTAVLSGEALEEVRRRAGVVAPEGGSPDTGGRENAGGSSPEAKPPQAAALLEIQPPANPVPVQRIADAIAAADPVEDETSGKKKKKKKKKGDERMRAAYISGLSRIVAQVLGVVLAVMLALYVNSMRSSSDKPAVIETSGKGKAKVKLSLPGAGTPFEGGTFEASGAVYVPGSNGVLIVDDGRSGEVLWMQVDEAGRQVGPLKPVPLGVTVDDPEGITSDGSYFYVIGSQSRPTAGDQNALVRFTFDAAKQSVQKAEVLAGLRGFLLANVPELKDIPEKSSDGGLNIEGIAWDFKRGRWLLGLRSPLAKDESALIVAIKLRNPAGPFSVDNLQLAEPNALSLKMDGLGIRDIQYDPEANAFLIIAGAPEHHEKAESTLWQWSGAVGQSGPESALRKEMDLDSKMKPEGVTHVESGGRKFLLVVGDASVYFKLDYAESQ